MNMEITSDANKRNQTFEQRGIDFNDAAHIFAGRHFTTVDNRKDYGEVRQITVGFLQERMMVVG
jgi:uncharacterized DUF497 family protein